MIYFSPHFLIKSEAETSASKKIRGTNAKAAEPTEASESNKQKDRKRKKNSAPETVISKRKKADTEPKEPQESNKPGTFNRIVLKDWNLSVV